MEVYRTSTELTQNLKSLYNKKNIGFVPTMGALHLGHLSLVEQALKDNTCVVVSIFVNPTQFDNTNDLKTYPRDLNQDVALLSTLKGKIVVFAPEASKLYNGVISSKKYSFGSIANEMEGKHRKGHFDGVGTVVNLLLKAVKPNNAYFGEKDFQQLQIVKRLVEIEKIPTRIVGCPILREPSGLAMSSRNKRLSSQQFKAASLISETLMEAKKRFKTQSISYINSFVENQFEENPYLTLEYFEIANVKTLKTAKRKRKDNQYRGFIAAFAGDVRLIDNMALN